MVKRMLIDDTHREETRVVVMNGTRLEDFEIETARRKQLKGNIYLAKVIRVEPSLQAAFVDYGGNRHGFLAFSEIHPDYYQIPVSDREALKAEVNRIAQENAKELEEEFAEDEAQSQEITAEYTHVEDAETSEEKQTEEANTEETNVEETSEQEDQTIALENKDDSEVITEEVAVEASNEPTEEETTSEENFEEAPKFDASENENKEYKRKEKNARNIFRRYKIQEVIKKNQILLIQITKEERGNKGAALTTYLSLAGRYCVLMPNSPNSGGVSRKITNMADRRKLKSILSDLPTNLDMSIIIRTAGLERNKAEITRDYNYLIRTWNQIRDTALKATAPSLIHEEGNLILRAIRDICDTDISEILVEGKDGYKNAKEFMKLITPSYARKVKEYKDKAIPLFHRFQVELQLESLHSSVVQLESGGYLVINPTEALVAIDVNSGRSTKERNIEETALNTNLEAADEVARQLRLRNLAGLVVIDFIDMEEQSHNHAVERRMREALKLDRSRVQVGKISGFGLMELSRQRMHSSFLEMSYQLCPHCKGKGLIRSIENSAIYVLRIIESEGIRDRSSQISITVPTDIALYILNKKRDRIAEIEERYGLKVIINGSDEMLFNTDYHLERIKKESEDTDDVVTVEEPIEQEQAQNNNHRNNRNDFRNRKDNRREAQKPREEAEEYIASEESDKAEEETAAKEERHEDKKRSRRRGSRGNNRRRKDKYRNREENQNRENSEETREKHHHHDEATTEVEVSDEHHSTEEHHSESEPAEKTEGNNKRKFDKRRNNKRRKFNDRRKPRDNNEQPAREQAQAKPAGGGQTQIITLFSNHVKPEEKAAASHQDKAPANASANDSGDDGKDGKKKGWLKRLLD